MMINNDLHSDLPIPPGEFLEEVLEDLGMTKDELAKRMNRPAAKLSAIFKGEKAITPDTALQLERTKQPPEKFERPLKPFLASCGVALVICPQLPGTYANGATFWLNNQKAVAMMTIRYRWSDIFWFRFFHELAHIILHRRTLVILEGNNEGPAKKGLEEEADKFAADTLIPREEYSLFIQNNRFYKEDIKLFASKMGIAPGIVVGRLQKEKRIEHSWHNDLRQRFVWSSD